MWDTSIWEHIAPNRLLKKSSFWKTGKSSRKFRLFRSLLHALTWSIFHRVLSCVSPLGLSYPYGTTRTPPPQPFAKREKRPSPSPPTVLACPLRRVSASTAIGYRSPPTLCIACSSFPTRARSFAGLRRHPGCERNFSPGASLCGGAVPCPTYSQCCVWLCAPPARLRCPGSPASGSWVHEGGLFLE